ncbi:MAG: undecaprenyl-diphosphate phosphatase [Vulcanimicrobiaceae bacterium]
MTWLQAMLLAILQGFSELFPISSLGHTVLVPALLHWKIDRRDPTFLAFVVALHLGTAIALIVFYWRDWVRIVRAFVASVVRGRLSDDVHERIGWLLVVGTIPVALLGVFLEKPVRELFGSSALVAGFLILNAFVMFGGEALRRRSVRGDGRDERALPQLPWSDGAKIGFAQSAALFPGISRSGASIVAGLVLRLSHEDAARYSFLLATPVIFAASALEVPQLLRPEAHDVLAQAMVGGVLAAITAYASVAFLTRYFEGNDLRPFGWYCLGFGTICLLLTLAKVIA